MNVTELGLEAKASLPALTAAGSETKNSLLTLIASKLEEDEAKIIEENNKDIATAREAGVSDAMIDRLTLTPARIKSMAEGVLQVAALPDPIGELLSTYKHANGMTIEKVRVPLGVIGMIFESRPNVTVDAAVLCLKAGNPVVLRGGREAIRSNTVLAELMREALVETGLPKCAIGLVTDTSRESANRMMKLNGIIDVLIPRGGASLIKSVMENATVPVIETGVGNCHVYVDSSCNGDMAASIVFNAKCSRPSVCNAAETLLIHKDAAFLLPKIKEMLDTKQVELRGCERTREILGNSVMPATDEDYATEFNDYILAVKVVDSIDEALAHIAKYGTLHSEAIVTDSAEHAERFLNTVDAAAVYHNVSTRFTDGFEFGLGAEIGISTQKMHARGPMGLKELTSIKYIVRGSGQIR